MTAGGVDEPRGEPGSTDGRSSELSGESGGSHRGTEGSRLAGRTPPSWLAAGYFLAIGLAAFLPTLGGGFLLQLDMVFAPDASHLRFALDAKGPLYYGRLPFVALLDAAGVVLPEWVVQRAVLVGTVSGAGYAAYAATGGQRPVSRLFAGTLYAVNPFIYVRLLAGQWYVALGYAVLPLAVVSFHSYVTGDRARPTRAVGWATLVAVFDPHVALLLALAGLAVLIPVTRSVGRAALVRAGRFGALAVGVNAYWLLPAVAVLLDGTSQLATVTEADLVVFSPRGFVAGNVPLSASMLYGFWRGGYTYPFDLLPVWVVVGLFALLLGLAVYGWFASDDPLADGLVLTAVVGWVLGMGVTTELSAPLFRALTAVPVGAGMREAGKFLGLVALAYALLGARGVTQLRADLDAALAARSPPDPGESAGRFDGDRFRQVATLALAVAVVGLPLVYTFPMVVGFWGGFEPAEYPDGWHAAADQFEADDEDYRVLSLPWHQYVEYEWTGRTVASPAPLFFDPPVVNSRDPDIGVGSQVTDPTHARLNELLAETDHETMGRELAPLGIKYVFLSKDADFRRYDFLRDQSDLTVVLETEHVVLFENTAFGSAPPPSAWPRAGFETPWRALLSGTVVSIASCARAGRRWS